MVDDPVAARFEGGLSGRNRLQTTVDRCCPTGKARTAVGQKRLRAIPAAGAQGKSVLIRDKEQGTRSKGQDTRGKLLES